MRTKLRLFFNNMEWKNLAPDLCRQRIIIEGTTEKIIEPDQIREYLDELAKVTKMEKLSGPYAYTAHDMGYGGWIHWKSSGAAFYSYPTNPPSLRWIAIPVNRFPRKKPRNLQKNFLTRLKSFGKK